MIDNEKYRSEIAEAVHEDMKGAYKSDVNSDHYQSTKTRIFYLASVQIQNPKTSAALQI